MPTSVFRIGFQCIGFILYEGGSLQHRDRFTSLFSSGLKESDNSQQENRECYLLHSPTCHTQTNQVTYATNGHSQNIVHVPFSSSSMKNEGYVWSGSLDLLAQYKRAIHGGSRTTSKYLRGPSLRLRGSDVIMASGKQCAQL